MRTSNSTSIAEAEAWCAKAATCEGFTFDNQRTPQQILFKDGMGGSVCPLKLRSRSFDSLRIPSVLAALQHTPIHPSRRAQLAFITHYTILHLGITILTCIIDSTDRSRIPQQYSSISRAHSQQQHWQR